MPAAMEAGRFEGELWRLDLNRVTSKSTMDRVVQITDGLLLIQDQDHVVHAIDLETGVHRWMVDVPGKLTQAVHPGVQGLSFVHGDRVVSVRRDIGSRMTRSLALDLQSWPFSDVVDAAGSLYFGNGAPAGLQSIDPDTGVDGWHYETKESVRQVLAYANGSSRSVIGFTEDGLMFSLDAWPAGGKRPRLENWYQRLPVARFVADATMDGDHFFVVPSDGFLYRVGAANGDILWRSPLSGDPGQLAPLSAVGSVYVATSAGIEAYDAKTGSEQWVCSGATRMITRIGDFCYTEEPGRTCGVHRATDGERVATFSLGDFEHVPSVPGGGVFIAGSGNGQLIALR